LAKILHEELYHHFLILAIATRVLVQDNLNDDMCDYAKKLLVIFVESCAPLYGKEMLVYNVHSLIHLPDDVKKFGPLDRFSAFPFESFLYQI